jgi:glycerol-3-phosphate acyltransferase PlsY
MPDIANPLVVTALIIAAYLIGSVPFAVVVSKLFGLQDPRSYGSGNPGATNVLRSGNKAAAALTLIGDAAKGWLAVWIAIRIGASPVVVALAALAVFLGHLYPLFLGFKGGKGVATALGVLLAIQPWLGAATALTWLLVAVFMRYSSLAAIAAAVFAPFYYVLGGNLVWQAEKPMTVAISAIALTLIYRHRANIGRLLKGTEPRIGKKKAA